jgi:RecA/RadA recombinase
MIGEESSSDGMAKKLANEHALIAGMSGGGKTTLAVDAIVEEADRGDTALVVEDPHTDSLGQNAFERLVARGHGSRILYDRLYNLVHRLGFDFLRLSTASDPIRRYAENETRVDYFTKVLLRRRGQDSLTTSPLTEEWTLNALWLYVEQSERKSLADLYHLFQPKDQVLAKFMDDCRDPDRVTPFKKIYDGKGNAGQIAPARRLIERVCRSPGFALRCGATFNFEEFLSNRGILIVEGGAFDTLSSDALRIILGSISLKTIEYVRNRPRPYPRVSHYLDEANNYGLVGEHEKSALAELRKKNYGCKILVQGLDFPSLQITEGVLNNCATHIWFCCSSSKLAQQAAADLGDPGLKDSLRGLQVGECYIRTPGNYRFYKHKMGEDPWVFPGLSKKKAEVYLETIRARPEFQSRGDSAMPPSKGDSKTTRPQSDNSSISSPAKRLRIEGSQNSAKEGGSDSSEV